MNTAIRRAQGLWIALAVVLAMGVAGTTVASAAPDARVSGLTAKQKKAKKKELGKCHRKRSTKQRKNCTKKVKKKYRRLATKHDGDTGAGKTYPVDVMDDYFTPDQLQLKINDWIVWDWRYSTSREGHNVNMRPPFPNGVIATDIQSSVMSGPDGHFKRQFTKPGTYDLFCTLHLGMTMTVQVSK